MTAYNDFQKMDQGERYALLLNAQCEVEQLKRLLLHQESSYQKRITLLDGQNAVLRDRIGVLCTPPSAIAEVFQLPELLELQPLLQA
jgi:hypothetical protein